ncbi:hypothetical protein BJX99DRAFT_269739 [Aspergillus californicus]
MADTNLLVSRMECAKISGDTIKVLVGSKEQPFFVHETLVRMASPFFDKAMNHPWKESQERCVKLPEDDPRSFEIFAHWLYFGKLAVNSEETSIEIDDRYLQLAKAYVLGNKLLCIKFQNDIIDAFIEKSDWRGEHGVGLFPDEDCVMVVYGNSMPSSPIRRLLVNMYVEHGDGSWLRKSEGAGIYPRAFLTDLAIELLDIDFDKDGLVKAGNYYIDQK